MKERIKRILIIRNIKLIKKLVKYKLEVDDLKEKIKSLELDKKELKDLNYELSSNNNYLIEQRKRYNKKNREYKRELEELRKEKKNERKN